MYPSPSQGLLPWKGVIWVAAVIIPGEQEKPGLVQPLGPSPRAQHVTCPSRCSVKADGTRERWPGPSRCLALGAQPDCRDLSLTQAGLGGQAGRGLSWCPRETASSLSACTCCNLKPEPQAGTSCTENRAVPTGRAGSEPAAGTAGGALALSSSAPGHPGADRTPMPQKTATESMSWPGCWMKPRPAAPTLDLLSQGGCWLTAVRNLPLPHRRPRALHFPALERGLPRSAHLQGSAQTLLFLGALQAPPPLSCLGAGRALLTGHLR